MQQKMNLLMIDLDGTIRKPKSNNKFIQDPQDQEIIPEAAEQLKKYKKEGYRIIGVTNQGGVAEKFKTIDECHEEQLTTLKLFPEISSIYFCPDSANKYLENQSICYKVERDNRFKKYYQSDINFIKDYYNSFIYDPSKEDIYYKTPEFRKPDCGMILIEKFVWEFINELSDILFVGDRNEDCEAATNANVRFLWANDWRNGKD